MVRKTIGIGLAATEDPSNMGFNHLVYALAGGETADVPRAKALHVIKVNLRIW